MKKSFFLAAILFVFSFCINAQNKPIVTDIQALASKGTRINVYWTLPQNPEPAITKLLIYRDTRPISSYNQLSGAYFLAELPPESCGYTDTVSDYNDYFYAVIAFTDRPFDLILVSMNSTVEGVHLIAPQPKDIEPKKKEEEKLYTDGAMRETPLPFLNYVEGQGEALISDEVAQQASQFSGYSTKTGLTPVSPYFFEEDLKKNILQQVYNNFVNSLGYNGCSIYKIGYDCTQDELLQCLIELIKEEEIEIYDYKPEELKGDIEIKNLTYKFPDSNDNVLKNINIEVKQGKSLGIIGVLGSGKTTLMN